MCIFRGIACNPMTEPQAELSEGQLESMRAFSKHWILHTLGVQNDNVSVASITPY
ncbi:MAG: hypothetical protein HUK20_05910 [Fibrobacter sp.]|nr:hypothetical protein [Fibrobacter sp.]